MTRLSGTVAVVTGGANGIGRACSRRFAAEGADVVIADVTDEAGAEVVAEVEALGRRAIYVHADATSQADNEQVMQTAVDQLGGLDVLVTSAGISMAGYVSGQQQATGALSMNDPIQSFLHFPVEDWEAVIAVNLTGTLRAVQAAGRHMVERKQGSIITIASIAAKVPEAGTPSYSVSKAGVWMLTKFASQALAPAGVRVNAIGPGYTRTNMTALITAVPGLEDHFLSRVPMGRWGEPEEIASVALFLASDDASYITGEIIHPDGGYYTE